MNNYLYVIYVIGVTCVLVIIFFIVLKSAQLRYFLLTPSFKTEVGNMLLNPGFSPEKSWLKPSWELIVNLRFKKRSY